MTEIRKKMSRLLKETMESDFSENLFTKKQMHTHNGRNRMSQPIGKTQLKLKKRETNRDLICVLLKQKIILEKRVKIKVLLTFAFKDYKKEGTFCFYLE